MSTLHADRQLEKLRDARAIGWKGMEDLNENSWTDFVYRLTSPETSGLQYLDSTIAGLKAQVVLVGREDRDTSR